MEALYFAGAVVLLAVVSLIGMRSERKIGHLEGWNACAELWNRTSTRSSRRRRAERFPFSRN